MKKIPRILSVLLVAVLFVTAMIPSAFARDFAPKFDAANIGVQTQYAYSENDVSWLRKLVIKEDMLSSTGLMTEAVLHPVTDYPYITDAPHFKAEVEECIRTYTLDEESQKAAYLYLLEQVGALTIISEPTTSDATKAEWLRNHGVIITAEEEKDPDKILLISALYAMMRNDLHYVYTGEHFEMPQGTPLEEAVVLYIAALSGNESSLAAFIYKYFGKTSLGSLEDYIYYTALFALWEEGLVTVAEIPTISREEVFRRLAIMSIKSYGLAIDSENASAEEIQQKYLTAMLGTHYRVKLDPESLIKARNSQSIPYYVLQRMASEDAGLTISHTKYTYEQCFDFVLKKTDRFDLEKEFYSDIYEYDVYLESNRASININPTPLNASSSISINGTPVYSSQYAEVQLRNIAFQTITIVSEHTVNDKTTSSTYKLNIIQGTTPPPESDLTGLVPTYGSSDTTTVTDAEGNIIVTYPSVSGAFPYVSGVNGFASDLIGQVLTLNEKGQLVDQYGNIIIDGTYETLPEGYKYVVGEGGIITVVLDTTAPATTEASGEKLSEEQMKEYIIIGSLILCSLLVIALIITLIVIKKRGKKTDAEKVRARRDKEKAKKAKLEAREMKKKKK